MSSERRDSGRRTSVRFFAGLLTSVLVRRTLKDANDTPAELRPPNGDYLPAGQSRSARLVDTEPYDAALKEIYDAVREGEEPDVVICGWLASNRDPVANRGRIAVLVGGSVIGFLSDADSKPRERW
jgi:hypothetical protein